MSIDATNPTVLQASQAEMDVQEIFSVHNSSSDSAQANVSDTPKLLEPFFPNCAIWYR